MRIKTDIITKTARQYRSQSLWVLCTLTIIGLLYIQIQGAAGRLEDFKRWMETVDRRKVLSLMDFSLSINHLMKGDRIIKAMMEVIPDVKIEDLPIHYCAVATDAR